MNFRMPSNRKVPRSKFSYGIRSLSSSPPLNEGRRPLPGPCRDKATSWLSPRITAVRHACGSPHYPFVTAAEELFHSEAASWATCWEVPLFVGRGRSASVVLPQAAQQRFPDKVTRGQLMQRHRCPRAIRGAFLLYLQRHW